MEEQIKERMYEEKDKLGLVMVLMEAVSGLLQWNNGDRREIDIRNLGFI